MTTTPTTTPAHPTSPEPVEIARLRIPGCDLVDAGIDSVAETLSAAINGTRGNWRPVRRTGTVYLRGSLVRVGAGTTGILIGSTPHGTLHVLWLSEATPFDVLLGNYAARCSSFDARWNQ